MITDILGYFAGFLCIITMFPQIYKIIKTKKADDISYAFLFIGSFSSVTWIAYGIMRPDYPIVMTDSLILIVQAFSFYITRKYKKKRLTIENVQEVELELDNDIVDEEVI